VDTTLAPSIYVLEQPRWHDRKWVLTDTVRESRAVLHRHFFRNRGAFAEALGEKWVFDRHGILRVSFEIWDDGSGRELARADRKGRLTIGARNVRWRTVIDGVFGLVDADLEWVVEGRAPMMLMRTGATMRIDSSVSARESLLLAVVASYLLISEGSQLAGT
jgi:hypothetical protein